MYIREIVPAQDCPILSKWREARGIPAPDMIVQLPLGYIIEDGPVELAAMILYPVADNETTGELLVNPSVAFSKMLIFAIKSLLSRAKEACETNLIRINRVAVRSPNHKQIMGKIDFITNAGPACYEFKTAVQHPH